MGERGESMKKSALAGVCFAIALLAFGNAWDASDGEFSFANGQTVDDVPNYYYKMLGTACAAAILGALFLTSSVRTASQLPPY